MSPKENDILVETRKNGVTTLRMNLPKQLNGWTGPMMLAIKLAFKRLGTDSETKVAILTGSDPYYCAGVNLSATIQPMHPQKLHDFICKNNAAIFDAFIDFPKPLMVAANGPAIGACVTSATLCDAIIASEKATFSTPFAKLGVPPEGCSSVHFERIMGAENAQRMLGPEGWIPTAQEALKAGIVHQVVPHDNLMNSAQARAEQWVKEGHVRNFANNINIEEYRAVNMRESKDLADAFVSVPFIDGQYKFLKSKGKTQASNTFWFLKVTRPLWSKLLK